MQNIGNVRLGNQEQAIFDALPSKEQPLGVLCPSRWEEPKHFWGSPTVMVTSQRIVVIKSRLFGQSKIDSEVSLLDVDSMGSGPVSAFGTWAVKISTRSGNDYGVYFVEQSDGLAFEEIVRQATNEFQQHAIDLLDKTDKPTGGP